MTDFSKILDKAKELEAKMKESQQKIKEIRVEGVSGSNSVKITLDGEGEMQTIKLSDEIMKENKTIIEDLIVAAHNSAKSQLKSKTTEEISKATGGLEFLVSNGPYNNAKYGNEIEDLIKLISKLPGLGPKSAKRIVLKLINNRDELVKPLAKSLADVYKNVSRCKIMWFIKIKFIDGL